MSKEKDRMKYGHVTGVDKAISRIVLGTAIMTIENPDPAFGMMDAYLEAGGNCIDTAAIYGAPDHTSERAVGAWFADRGTRDDVVLIGKGACVTTCTPDLVTSEMRESLDRLQTDRLDIYIMHRDNPSIPAGEFVEVLNQHLREGRVKAFGGSNWLPERIQEANDYAAAHGLVPFTVSSPNFSLGQWNEAQWDDCYTASDLETRRWYETHDVALFAWSSQAGGFFTGRFSEEDRSNPAYADTVRVWFNEGNFRRLGRARELAEQKGVSSTQVALAYVLSQDFNAFALIGPHTVEELRSSLSVGDLTLTPEERAYLNLESKSVRESQPA